MRYENSMVKIADDIIRDQQAERKVQNKKQKWHDEYATLKFFGTYAEMLETFMKEKSSVWYGN